MTSVTTPTRPPKPRIHRSSAIVALGVLGVLLLANLPGRIAIEPSFGAGDKFFRFGPLGYPPSCISGPRFFFSNEVTIQQGWPWRYRWYPEYFDFNSPQAREKNFSWISLWNAPDDMTNLYGEALPPSFDGWALAADCAVAGILAVAAGLLAEVRRRRRARWYQFSLAEAACWVAVLALALTWLKAQRDEYQRENVAIEAGDYEGPVVKPSPLLWFDKIVGTQATCWLDRIVDYEKDGPFPLTSLKYISRDRMNAAEVETFARRGDLQGLCLFMAPEPDPALTSSELDPHDTVNDENRQKEQKHIAEVPRAATWPLLEPAPELTGEQEATVEKIAALTSLRWLYLGDASNRALAHFDQLRQLEILVLDGGTVDDAGLTALARLPKLRVLLLGATVTDAGLKTLGTLPAIEELDLDFTWITNEGLMNLSSLRTLRAVYLGHLNYAYFESPYPYGSQHGCRLTEAGIKRISKALPACEFHTADGYWKDGEWRPEYIVPLPIVGRHDRRSSSALATLFPLK